MKYNLIYAAREPNRASVLLEALSRNNFSVTVARRAKEVQGLLAQGSCDLLLLAQELMDEEGISFLKAIRSRGFAKKLPVVALLESPDALMDHGHEAGHGQGKMSARLAFFQMGADECLIANQDIQECLARIKAVLRRTLPHPQEEVLKMGEIELNLSSYTLKVKGKEIPLTSKELDLLYVFLSSPNRVLSRPYLIERVWGYNYFGSPRTVDVHVRRLREKLAKASRYIHTIPCVGYKLVPP
ncbi:MAG: response regulator transcription factor [Elusimicrobia bacterium]|nr:response regulator transcription factor [Elusimicrobiota bacterium]